MMHGTLTATLLIASGLLSACAGEEHCGNARLIAAGYGDSAIALADGRVFVWGRGDGTPKEWLPAGEAPSQIAMSLFTRCAVDANHDLICNPTGSWSSANVRSIAMSSRYDPSHALSLDESSSRFAPRCIVDLEGRAACQWGEGTDFVAVGDRVEHLAVGAEHVCFSRTGEGVTCQGHAFSAGSLVEARWARDLGAIGPNVTQLASNGESVCAVNAEGQLWCWGHNLHGQAGTRNENELDPVLVSGVMDAKVTSVSMGAWHVCATTEDGGLWCWGENPVGELGYGKAELVQPEVHPPTRVPDLPGGAAAVAAGWGHTCAIDGTGDVWCWGRNDAGQLGTGSEEKQSDSVLGLLGAPGLRERAGRVVTCD
jgi:alpha-tubulin suppressor-like RCC1 family protein